MASEFHSTAPTSNELYELNIGKLTNQTFHRSRHSSEINFPFTVTLAPISNNIVEKQQTTMQFSVFVEHRVLQHLYQEWFMPCHHWRNFCRESRTVYTHKVRAVNDLDGYNERDEYYFSSFFHCLQQKIGLTIHLFDDNRISKCVSNFVNIRENSLTR